MIRWVLGGRTLAKLCTCVVLVRRLTSLVPPLCHFPLLLDIGLVLDVHGRLFVVPGLFFETLGLPRPVCEEGLVKFAELRVFDRVVRARTHDRIVAFLDRGQVVTLARSLKLETAGPFREVEVMLAIKGRHESLRLGLVFGWCNGV